MCGGRDNMVGKGTMGGILSGIVDGCGGIIAEGVVVVDGCEEVACA